MSHLKVNNSSQQIHILPPSRPISCLQSKITTRIGMVVGAALIALGPILCCIAGMSSAFYILSAVGGVLVIAALVLECKRNPYSPTPETPSLGQGSRPVRSISALSIGSKQRGGEETASDIPTHPSTPNDISQTSIPAIAQKKPINRDTNSSMDEESTGTVRRLESKKAHSDSGGSSPAFGLTREGLDALQQAGSSVEEESEDEKDLPSDPERNPSGSESSFSLVSRGRAAGSGTDEGRGNGGISADSSSGTHLSRNSAISSRSDRTPPHPVYPVFVASTVPSEASADDSQRAAAAEFGGQQSFSETAQVGEQLLALEAAVDEALNREDTTPREKDKTLGLLENVAGSYEALLIATMNTYKQQLDGASFVNH